MFYVNAIILKESSDEIVVCVPALKWHENCLGIFWFFNEL